MIQVHGKCTYCDNITRITTGFTHHVFIQVYDQRISQFAPFTGKLQVRSVYNDQVQCTKYANICRPESMLFYHLARMLNTINNYGDDDTLVVTTTLSAVCSLTSECTSTEIANALAFLQMNMNRVRRIIFFYVYEPVRTIALLLRRAGSLFVEITDHIPNGEYRSDEVSYSCDCYLRLVKYDSDPLKMVYMHVVPFLRISYTTNWLAYPWLPFLPGRLSGNTLHLSYMVTPVCGTCVALYNDSIVYGAVDRITYNDSMLLLLHAALKHITENATSLIDIHVVTNEPVHLNRLLRKARSKTRTHVHRNVAIDGIWMMTHESSLYYGTPCRARVTIYDGVVNMSDKELDYHSRLRGVTVYEWRVGLRPPRRCCSKCDNCSTCKYTAKGIKYISCHSCFPCSGNAR